MPEKERTASSVIKKIIRIVLLWIPVALISLLIMIFTAAGIYLTPSRVENIAAAVFNKMSYGSLSLKVKTFSLLRGFEANSIVINNGSEFGKTKFVEIDRLVLKYNLFSILIGNLNFKEIGIYNPKVYLKQKNGIWNASRLMKPGREEVKEPEKSPEKESDEVSLPISVKLFLKFRLENLRLYVYGDSFNSSIEGLTYNLDMFVPPVKVIPRSLKIIRILRTIKMELNPSGYVDIAFANKDSGVKSPLVLSWKLVFDNNNGSGEFASSLRLGTQKMPVRYRNSFLAPLNFLIAYDLLYDPAADHLKISSLSVSLKNNKWLNLEGDVNKVSTKQELNIRITESKINLSDIYPYFASLTGDKRTMFSGVLSLFPMAITGNISHSNLKGNLDLKNIYFKNPDVETILPKLKLAYLITKNNEDIRISAGIDMPIISVNTGRDKLGSNGLGVRADLSVINMRRVNLHDLTVRVFNPGTKRSALDLAVKGDVNLKPDLSGNLNVTQLTFQRENFSEGIREKFLSGFNLKKPVDINLNLNFALANNKTKAVLALHAKVPDYKVNDLKINADIEQNMKEKRVQINIFNVRSSDLGVKVDAAGWVETAASPLSNSDVMVTAEYFSPEMIPVYGPWNLSGKFSFSFYMKGDTKTGRTSGNIIVKNLFLKNKESLLSVEDVNLDFPFEYSFSSGPVESRIAVDKTALIDNENFKQKENFTIRSVKAIHPVRKQEFEYARDFAAAMFFRNNAFEITKMKMYALNGAVYGRDILFYLADLPSTGSYKNVEYRLVLDATNVDIGRLDNPDKKEKSGAELSLNARFTGQGLDMFLGKEKDRGKELNIKGFININKVGEQFAKRLFEGLNEERGKSKIGFTQYIVDNTMTIKGFNYNLDIGLMDVEVSLARKAIGYLILVEDIKMTRIPIQDYLNNIFGRKPE